MYKCVELCIVSHEGISTRADIDLMPVYHHHVHCVSNRLPVSDFRWHLFVALLLNVLLLLPTPGEARIHACPDASGSIIYQDRPCPLKKSVVKKVNTTQGYPLGIHESWFIIPDQAVERAFCDRRGCECGAIERKHNASLERAVADSLYLDGSWHRYEMSYQQWLKSDPNSADAHLNRESMLEASCEIMMSQVLLRNFAQNVATTLRKQTQTAEERGFDIEPPCLQDIPDACRYLESTKLHRRLVKDAGALRQARESLLSDESSLSDLH